jgi:hypothetical protein
MTAQSLKQRVARGSGGGMGLSFHWVAFDIEGMLGEKMVSRSFGGAAGHGERAPGAGAAHPTTTSASKRVS